MSEHDPGRGGPPGETPAEGSQPGGEDPGAAYAEAGAGVAPGWYPDPAGSGLLRWWDGNAWGVLADAPPAGAMVASQAGRPAGGTDPKTMAMLAEGLGLVVGLWGPLIIYMINGQNGDPFVRHHAAEALNFHLTLLIPALVGGLTACFGVGIVILIAVIIVDWVFGIMALMAASRGEWYKYPISIRMVSGAAY